MTFRVRTVSFNNSFRRIKSRGISVTKDLSAVLERNYLLVPTAVTTVYHLIKVTGLNSGDLYTTYCRKNAKVSHYRESEKRMCEMGKNPPSSFQNRISNFEAIVLKAFSLLIS